MSEDMETIGERIRKIWERRLSQRKVICRTHLDPRRHEIEYWKIPGMGDCSVCMPDERNVQCSRYQPIVIYGAERLNSVGEKEYVGEGRV